MILAVILGPFQISHARVESPTMGLDWTRGKHTADFASGKTASRRKSYSVAKDFKRGSPALCTRKEKVQRRLFSSSTAATDPAALPFKTNGITDLVCLNKSHIVSYCDTNKTNDVFKGTTVRLTSDGETQATYKVAV